MERSKLYFCLIAVAAIAVVGMLAILRYGPSSIGTVCNCPAIISGRPTTPGPAPCHCPLPITQQNSTTINTYSNTTTTTPPQNSISGSIYGPAYELKNVSIVDPNANLSTFSCSVATDCTVVQTTRCFNNEPQQQACINANYSGAYSSYYESFLHSNGTVACPLFLMAGTASCACIYNGCSLTYSDTQP